MYSDYHYNEKHSKANQNYRPVCQQYQNMYAISVPKQYIIVLALLSEILTSNVCDKAAVIGTGL